MIPANSFQREIVAADLNWLAESHPGMIALVDLYRNIDHLQSEIASSVVGSSAGEPALHNSANGGWPVLEAHDIALEAGQLASWVETMRELMALHGVQARGGEAELVATFTTSELQELARDGLRLRAGPTDEPFAGTLTRLALGQVVSAILRGTALSRCVNLDTTDWQRGYCPVCGGWPDLGALDANKNTQTLVCGRCDTMWPYRRVGCPFCATDEEITFYASSDENVRLSVCGACKSYLKQVRLPMANPVRSILGLRLLTVGQDLDAQEAGWNRPRV